MTTPSQELLQFNNGNTVDNLTQWEARRRELLAAVIPLEYGGMPPAPASTRAEQLHEAAVRTLDGVAVRTLRVISETPQGRAPFGFILKVYIPPSIGPRPVVIAGDGCWEYLSEQVRSWILSRGYLLAVFNRVELAADAYNHDRNTGLHCVFPEHAFGALAAWAWGYHRCVDVLTEMPGADSGQIAVTGHSRGGKTVLLAGATDDRIALTAANGSGTGGAALYKCRSEGAEPLDQAKINRIGYWYGPDLAAYVDRPEALPFDQHMLLGAIAPRSLLVTEAAGDLWANPRGTRECLRRVRTAYEAFDGKERIGYHLRQGLHAHQPSDWQVFLDFADWRFRDRTPPRTYEIPPEKD